MLTELKYLLNAREREVFGYVQTVLPKLGYKVLYDRENYILAVPQGSCTPVCLVAHMDTVRDTEDRPIKLRQMGTTIYNKNGVLGADDRAGVSIILNIARKSKHLPYLLFTLGEETGCTGVKEFIKQKVLDPYLSDINAFLEFDRRGHNEVVYYNTRIPTEFKTILDIFGYEKTFGSTSDVRHLTEHYGIAHANLSAGFFRQHTEWEYLNIYSFLNAVESGLKLMGHMNKVFVLDPPPFNTAYHSKGAHRHVTSAYVTHRCELCGRQHHDCTYFVHARGYLCPTCEDAVRRRDPYDRVTQFSFASAKKGATTAGSVSTTLKGNSLPKLVDSPGLGVCPICGESKQVVRNLDKDCFDCYSCKTAYYIEQGEKVVWYLDKNLGQYIKLTTPAIPAESSPTTVPQSCVCGREGKLYPVAFPGKGVLYFCESCLEEAVEVDLLTVEEKNKIIQEGMKVPF